MTNTIKIKATYLGETKKFTACFYGHGDEKFDQIKETKTNNAIDCHDVPGENTWGIQFPFGDDDLFVFFEIDENGHRTSNLLNAVILTGVSLCYDDDVSVSII